MARRGKAIRVSAEDALEFEPEEAPKRRIPATFWMLIALVLITVAGLGGFLFGDKLASLGSDGPAEVPIVHAEPGPIKVRPQNPGGEKIPFRGNEVYQRAAGQAAPARVEKLMPAPEKPIAKPVEKLAQTPNQTPAQTSSESAAPVQSASPPAAPQAPVSAPAAQPAQTSAASAPAPVPAPQTPPRTARAESLLPAPPPPAPEPVAPKPVAKVIPPAPAPKPAAPVQAPPAPAPAATPSTAGAPLRLDPKAPKPPAPVLSAQQTASAATAPPTPPKPLEPVSPPVRITGAPKNLGAPLSAAQATQTAAVQKGWQVQLAASRSAKAASAEGERLKKKHSDLLGKYRVAVVRADLGAKGVFYRIRLGPVSDKAAARSTCGALSKRGQGCLVVAPGK